MLPTHTHPTESSALAPDATDTLRQQLTDGHARHALIAKMETRELRTLFLKLTRHLPHGRSGLSCEWAFRNAARSTDPIDPRGMDLRDLLREVMQTAVDTADESVIDGTQIDITRYLDSIKAHVFAVIPDNEPKPLAESTVHATKETAEALAAMAEAGTTRQASAIENAMEQAQEAVVAIHKFHRAADRGLRMGSRQSMQQRA